jgi:glycosyltransferase involved in cell wall biosynthesis
MTLKNTGDKASRRSLAINAGNIAGSPVGIANYAWHLTAELRRLVPDLEITLIHPPQLKDYFSSLPGVRLVSVPALPQLARVLLNQLIVPWHARRASLLHSVGNYGVFLRRAPQSIIIQDTYEKVSRDRFGAAKRLLLSFLVSGTGRRARVVLTSSENNRKDIARHYPHLAAKTVITPLGTKFPPQPDSVNRPRSGFLFVGTLEPGKRVGDILEAFAPLAAKYPHKLCIVGQKGWGDTAWGEKAAALGLGDAVEFTGYVSDEKLKQLYLDSLALVQASSYEGFGLPVVEAMACGCPVIAARNSALIELGEGVADFFPTGDVPALRAAMERVILDAGHVADASKKSLARAENYTWGATAAATLKAFAPFLDLAPRQ